MPTELEQAYDHCQRVARENAKNFYYAFRTLPASKRRAVYAVYAYCRLCDDVADGDLSTDRKREELDRIRGLVAGMHKNGIEGPLAAEFRALRDAAGAFRIPDRYLEEVVDGVESDLHKNRFANFAELREYCYKVASVVGLICIEVFGYQDPLAKEYAVDMGIALQLTNILRDVKEDAERDRIYIPQDEMARCGYTEEDLLTGTVNDAFRNLMKEQVDRARSYYARSRPLFDLLDRDARACPRVLHAAYGAILDRIEDSGFDVYARRIGLSTRKKLAITARLWLGTLAPGLPVLGGRR